MAGFDFRDGGGGGGGAVSSVFGRTGVVSGQAGDYTAAQVTGAAALAGQLGGTAASPDVRGVRETSGPTLLTLGAIADGEVLARSGSAIVGATASGPVSRDFVTMPLSADYYAATAPGADDFVVAVAVRLEAAAQQQQVFTLAYAGDRASEGWLIENNFGVLRVGAFDSTGALFAWSSSGANYFPSQNWSRAWGHTALLALRVYTSGGTTRLQVHLNGGFVYELSAGTSGVTASTTVAQFGGGVSGWWGTGCPPEGSGLLGFCYLDGTLTDAQMAAWGRACLDGDDLVTGGLTWDLFKSTSGGTPGATWAGGTGTATWGGAGSPATVTRRVRWA